MSAVNAIPEYDSSQDRTGIFHAVLEDPALPPFQKTTSRLGEEAMGVMAAGTATTAQSLTFMTYHLCRQPALKAKLRAELRNCQGRRPIPLQQLEQLPLLTGVIKEALRLGFPGPNKTDRIAPDRTVVYPGQSSDDKPKATPHQAMGESRRNTHCHPGLFWPCRIQE